MMFTKAQYILKYIETHALLIFRICTTIQASMSRFYFPKRETERSSALRTLSKIELMRTHRKKNIKNLREHGKKSFKSSRVFTVAEF